MADTNVNTQLAVNYLANLNVPLSVSVMSKLMQFSFLQQLGYSGQIGSIKKDFLGLEDFNQLMNTYSSTNTILNLAWATISPLAPLNLQVAKQTYIDPDLGVVGNLFQSLQSFAQVFSLSDSDLDNPDQITSAIDSLG